jgi:myo-inositol-1(or 4)-monophosphatase
MLNIAMRAARKAGDIIVRALEQGHNLRYDLKSQNDYVTEVDRKAEAAIIEILLRAYPEHGILAEESGSHPGKEGYLWIIDPLDGTTNFIHGFPQFAVSIGLEHQGRIEQAVVYDPLLQEMFSASRGHGAFLNDRRIRVSQASQMQHALLGTGFPFRSTEYLETYLCTFRELFPNTAGVRRAGSAALDLAYVAAGRLDGFWEFSLKPWDLAAGTLLIQEAGGLVSDMRGQQRYLDTGHVLTANPRLHRQLLEIVGACLPSA